MKDNVGVPQAAGLGERIRTARRARGMSRQAAAALCGRSEEWLRKIERGQRGTSLKMVARLAEVLHVPDLSDLLDSDAPTVLYARPAHPDLAGIRAAILAPPAAPAGTGIGTLDGLRVDLRRAWRLRSASPRDRSDLAAALPRLIAAARTAAGGARTPTEQRDTRRVLAETYHLSQLYLCYQDASELLWLVVDRAMNAARESEDAAAVGRAAWFTAYLYRDFGMVDHAHQVVEEAVRHLDADPEQAPRLQRQRRAVYLSSAWNYARDGRPALAWRAWDAAVEAEQHGGAPVSPHLLFGADCQDVALTLDVELGRPAAAVRRAERLDIDAVPSVPRRARLMIEASRGYLLRREHAGALHMLRAALRVSTEATVYSRDARGIAHDLVNHAGPMLRRDAAELADELGVHTG